jgi:hypothetical protein
VKQLEKISLFQFLNDRQLGKQTRLQETMLKHSSNERPDYLLNEARNVDEIDNNKFTF